jgi:RHS repeat-associated protein
MGLEKRIGIYAGQYFDAETGLHYNYHRYYDPSIGRYLTPDPIGLAGGINLFAYAGLNPINAFDPFGLYESSPWLMWVPGQHLWDRGLTAFENGQYGWGTAYIAGMVGEQALFALSFGQYGAAEIGGQCAAQTAIEGFSQVELGIINEARSILNSSQMVALQAANKAGNSVAVNIGGRLIQYEPGLQASGMTMFGENGFLLGREAFASSEELSKTILHELFRLSTSASSSGVSATLAASETNAAFSFAERAIKALLK